MSKSIILSDKTFRQISRKFRKEVGEKQYRQMSFHAAAFSFLTYHFEASQYDDSVLTNLRNLLRTYFNAGVRSTRKAKRRK